MIINAVNDEKYLGDVLVRSDLNVPMVNNEISDDDKHKYENIVQKVTDDYINNIEKIFQKKHSEILDTN